MRTVYLENRGRSGSVEHSKWYRITDTGRTVDLEWGATGAKGSKKTAVTSDCTVERTKTFESQLTRRKKRGYVVIDGDGGPVEQRPEGGIDRKFGLEIETHTRIDMDTIIAEMRKRGLTVNDSRSRYFHSNGDAWDVKRDGSCGYEFASPILNKNAGVFDAKIAVEKIREISGPNAVNASCGIHVTVDVSDFSIKELKRLIIGYMRAQEHFYNKCIQSRRTNTYCKMNPTTYIGDMIHTPELGQVARLACGDRLGGSASRNLSHNQRYYGFNMTNMFGRNPRVEFRMLEGTVSIRKVGDWIHTCVGFVEGVKKCGVTFKSTGTFRKDTFDQIVKGEWML